MIKWCVAAMVAILLPVAAGDEVTLARQTYINDIYKFVLPIPQGTTACVSPKFSDLHGFILLLSGTKCEDNTSLPSLDISAFWNMSRSAKSQQIDASFCESKQSKISHVLFGDIPLYQCDPNANKKIIRFYGIKSIAQSRGPVGIVYFIEARNLSGNSIDVEARIKSILSNVRFLTR
jgi:hypothetical protein